VGLFPKE